MQTKSATREDELEFILQTITEGTANRIPANERIILPLLSTRTRGNNQWRILADGNAQPMLHRFFRELQAGAIFCVPMQDQWWPEDRREFARLWINLELNLWQLLPVRYGDDITHTRQDFWSLQQGHTYPLLKNGLWATGIALPETDWQEFRPPAYYQLNVSKHRLDDQRLCATDAQWQRDCTTIAYAEQTLLLDAPQLAFIAERTNLASKCLIARPELNPDVISAIGLSKPITVQPYLSRLQDSLLVCFRLNDPEYGLYTSNGQLNPDNLERLLNWHRAKGPILVCDHTFWLDSEGGAELAKLFALARIPVIRPSKKAEFYWLLTQVGNVLHPRDNEIFHFLVAEIAGLGLSDKLCKWSDLLPSGGKRNA